MSEESEGVVMTRTCMVVDCEKPRHPGWPLCAMHSKRVERYNDLNGGPGRGAPGRPRKPRKARKEAA